VHIIYYLASKTISLSEEAYEKLKAEKRKGESFSAVVKRLIGRKPSRPLRVPGGTWMRRGSGRLRPS
jgi:predicted CopG family antitoxin